MPENFSEMKKTIGIKQSRKAVREERARRVFLASDADPALLLPVRTECERKGVPMEDGYTMAQLGKACGIDVGASVVAQL